MPDPAGRGHLRRASFLLACLAVLMSFALFVPGPAAVQAQQDQAEADKAADQPPPQPAQARSKSLFLHMLESIGWVFGALYLAISITLVALVVLLAMDLRMAMAIPPLFVEEFTDTVNKRKFKEAYDLARNDSSFLGRVLATGMSRLQYGIEDAREAAFNMVDSIKASKEQLIAYLAVIGTVGPLIGLVGTVYGMILAFRELSQGKTPNPQELSNAISHALVLTLVGVALAVPAIFCHTFFKSRLTRISTDTGNMSDDLLTQMYHNSKRPAAPAAAAAPSAVATPAVAQAAIRPVQ